MFTNFEYAGEKLSDYGMILCKFDSSGGIETVSSGSDITFNQIALNRGSRFFIGSSTYESPLTTTFQICKNPCTAKTQDEMAISSAEISALQRWLCRKNQYHKFKINKEGFEHIYWNATFSTKQIELNGQVIGMELTLYADAPFAYMDEITVIEDCSNSLTFDLYDISDEEGYIYPDMEIKINESGDFRLENNLDKESTGRFLLIKNCIEGEVITINGKSHTINSSMSHNNITNDFNYCFPRIINSYIENKNTFTSNLKCIITFTYSPIRKVGI